MEEKESVVLEQVRKIFMRFGIKSVTMDDISRELKISKKTLYKFVTDKPDLVAKVMKAECDGDRAIMEEMVASSKNAIDEMLGVLSVIGQKVKEIHPSIHYDLEKYYPEAWAIFSEYKRNFVLNCVTQNLVRGMREGLYRDNLNPDVIGRIYASRVDMIFDAEIFPAGVFDFGEVFLEMIRYHIRGIASEKGVKYLNEKLKNEKIKI